MLLILRQTQNPAILIIDIYLGEKKFSPTNLIPVLLYTGGYRQYSKKEEKNHV
jgi:hypothetical protein